MNPDGLTKSGLIVGRGETEDEVLGALADLAASLRHTGASPSVEHALDEAWHAMHATEPAVAVSGPAFSPRGCTLRRQGR